MPGTDRGKGKTMIKQWIVAVCLALATLPAVAEEVHPGEGKSVLLNDLTGVVYYTVTDTGYRVVATFAPLRVTATLTPGQSMEISVPNALGKAPTAMLIARTGNMLTLGPLPIAIVTAPSVQPK